ncbi:MAG TPA: MarR family transcriptional regulator [Clostridiales bacterium]|nr:MarR family transcriptional regulator [Clostridiales bacterium]
MKLEWLGKHRNFIEGLIQYTNVYSQIYNLQGFHNTSVPCSVAQIQVLEYILENEDKNEKMAEVADRLGVSSSAFSKNVKKMTEKKLLEKYRSNTNRKDIIIKVSPLGKQVYDEYVKSLYEKRFRHTFELLDKIPSQYIDIVSEVLRFNAESINEQIKEYQGSNQVTEETPIQLIRIDD